ncbi:hypothetical protein HMPREF9412_5572 [Paenibacillus sp. HGF5]|nr:hypothetical protein HMPREF9412_5572 [Paenibacillus sp. HGF5]
MSRTAQYIPILSKSCIVLMMREKNRPNMAGFFIFQGT